MAYRVHRRIEVDISFVAFLCIYYYCDPANTFFPFLTAATLHEAGHLVVLRCLGVRVDRLLLSAQGAILFTEPLSYRRELLAASGGPCVNFLLLLFFARRLPIFALVNLCLLVYNLLPVYPLDGGRILRALLSILLPTVAASITEKAITGAAIFLLSAAAVALTCVYHIGLWPILALGMLLLRAAMTSCGAKTQRVSQKIHKRCCSLKKNAL